MTTTEKELFTAFRGLRLEYFTFSEVVRYFRRKNNSIPPKKYWGNLFKCLKLMDVIRRVLGKPVKITSSYRSPKYNAGVGGKSKSYHLKAMAIDFQVSGMTPRQVVKVVRELRKLGVFKGGIGLYSTFVHVDIRGYSANW